MAEWNPSWLQDSEAGQDGAGGEQKQPGGSVSAGQVKGQREAEDTSINVSVCLLPECGAILEPAKRGGVRRFCNARHRMAYRDLMLQQAVASAIASVEEARDSFDQLAAAAERHAALMSGALAHLQKLVHSGKRRKRR